MYPRTVFRLSELLGVPLSQDFGRRDALSHWIGLQTASMKVMAVRFHLTGFILYHHVYLPQEHLPYSVLFREVSLRSGSLHLLPSIPKGLLIFQPDICTADI